MLDPEILAARLKEMEELNIALLLINEGLDTLAIRKDGSTYLATNVDDLMSEMLSHSGLKYVDRRTVMLDGEY